CLAPHLTLRRVLPNAANCASALSRECKPDCAQDCATMKPIRAATTSREFILRHTYAPKSRWLIRHGRPTPALLRPAALGDVLPRRIVDNHDSVLIARAMAHQDHVARTCVHELIERSAGDQRRHAGLEHSRTAIGKSHRALAPEAGEHLILVVAVQ